MDVSFFISGDRRIDERAHAEKQLPLLLIGAGDQRPDEDQALHFSRCICMATTTTV